jgi:hypothetical protein
MAYRISRGKGKPAYVFSGEDLNKSSEDGIKRGREFERMKCRKKR